MSSNQLNFSPRYIKPEGFYLFAYFDAWISPPASLSGEEGFTRTTAVPQQQCNQRAAALQAALACNTADARREDGHPLSHLISHTSPLLLIEPICTGLKGTAGLPELSRAWSPVPSRDWIFAGFVLILLPPLPGFIYWLSLGKTLRVNKELLRTGVHLPAASYSQNKTEFLGQLPQSPLIAAPISTPRPFLMLAFLFSHLPSNWLVLKVHQLCLLICIW